jgi:aerobic carbon-monoxide dehydrogenase small subunit
MGYSHPGLRRSFNRWRRRMAVTKKNHNTRKASETRRVSFTVNGQDYQFNVGSEPHEISQAHTLSHTLRETLGLTGTKISCDQGACGCCTVIMDGKAVLSCKVLTVECDGKSITTIEGLKNPNTGALDPLQQSFIDHTAFQCGYCTPGMIMTAKALLNENPSPTEDEIKEALSGNFCRCISHYQVIRAVMSAVKKEE